MMCCLFSNMLSDLFCKSSSTTPGSQHESTSTLMMFLSFSFSQLLSLGRDLKDYLVTKRRPQDVSKPEKNSEFSWWNAISAYLCSPPYLPCIFKANMHISQANLFEAEWCPVGHLRADIIALPHRLHRTFSKGFCPHLLLNREEVGCG